MHEEVADRSVNLAIRSSKVTSRGLVKALSMYARHLKNKSNEISGEQSVKDLIKQGQGVASAEIGDKGIKDFKRIANKYGVDFSIVKDKATDPPVYTVFFKARDADAITQILKEYSAKQFKNKDHEKRPSVLKKLKKYVEIVSRSPRKDKEKNKEHER